MASQWIPDDPALWRIDRYPDFLAARRELLAGAANAFLGALRRARHPARMKCSNGRSWSRTIDDQDTRNEEIAALIVELTELGCAEPAVDCEISDPGTGKALAIAEACWPEGLQPGQGNPVVLELDPGESDLARLEELGYEVFTSTDSLRGYVHRRNQEAAGPVEEPAGLAENVGNPSAAPDGEPGPDVRAEFERAMKDVYVRAKSEANYTASYLIGMLSSYGGLGTAQRLLASTEVSSGFAALYERDRLDLTVEALVIQSKFASLFTDEELTSRASAWTSSAIANRVVALRPPELAFTGCALVQPDTRRGRPDEDGARQCEQDGADKRAAMAERGNANFDLSRLQQLLKTALYPFDRHRLACWRAACGHDHVVTLHTQNGVRPTHDSRDRLPNERFKEDTGSRHNRHSSDYRQFVIDR